ncbi:MAG: hypothetical protein H7336_01710 [Bacteriovorax sp.]|nr:hypothetical protein [Bacteriovorax sp.]
MSEELSNSVFSITGRTGRLAYFFQNSLLMLFGFQYIYGPYIGDAIKSMQHNPMFANVFILLQSDPSYADMLKDFGQAQKFTFTLFAARYAFIIALRIIDLKRIRDIVNRQLTKVETISVFIIFSLPFVDLISTIVLMTLPPKKSPAISTFLKEAHAVNLHEAQKERLVKRNKELFDSGKISKAEYIKFLEKYNVLVKKQ